jgi:signal transduction histidine kinase
MLKSLYGKLTLAFLLVAFTTAALVALFIRLTSANRLQQLVVDQQRSRLEQSLGSYYLANGSWTGVADTWQQIQSQTFPTPSGSFNGPPPQNNRPPDGPGRSNFLGLADAQGVVIVSVDANFPAGSTLPLDVLRAGVPVSANGVQVGTILTARQPPGLNPQETQYLNRTTEALIFASLGALVVALAMGILLARTLTRPLNALTQAAQRITQGQLEQEVKVRSNDEIGQLAEAFNRMSQEVARVNQLRRQMTADIAHDLRTPLTVISGYVESMRDGDLKPTPERFALIYSEIERLQNLVGDLRMLSMADAGELSLNPQSLSPRNLLERAAPLFRHQAEGQQVGIRVEAGEDLPSIRVDEARMIQVLGNLISNALRYSLPGGTITLAAQSFGDEVEIDVEDTGVGIPEEELPYIFNRFHRGDKSRHTETGETGLGLAIVKALVEAHGGNVTAESKPDEGTVIRLVFPSDQSKSKIN